MFLNLFDKRKKDDDEFIKRSEIYIPEYPHPSKENVRHIELSYEQAVQQGWHFKRKSRRRIRITRYTGSERDIIIPAVIDGRIVNEIGKAAFHRTDIDSAKLPDTIKKLKERCFFKSSVKTVIFAEGVVEIPEGAFSYCEKLERVHLPTTLMNIGNRAFFYCKKLSYIDIPCNRIGEEAFRYSGLNGFAYNNIKYQYFFADGSAFSNTPMQTKYKLILHRKTKEYDYDILLAGTLADVKLPGSSVYLHKNSVMHGCRLDFSECTSVSADAEAFNCVRAGGATVSYPACTVIMPYGKNEAYIPDFIDSYYPDGKKYIGGITVKSKTADKTVLYANTYKLPPYSVKCESKHIEILSSRNLDFCGCAVSSYELESLDIIKLGINYLNYFEEELFSERCRHLHKFSWNGKCVYIPSDEIILRQAHTEMLKAFTKIYNGTSWSFFDSSCIDRVFTEPVNRYSSEKRKRLSQRNKILIAVDVLRSSEGLFENKGMYEKYLRTHKTYAENVCRELPEKWREYEIFLKSVL